MVLGMGIGDREAGVSVFWDLRFIPNTYNVPGTVLRRLGNIYTHSSLILCTATGRRFAEAFKEALEMEL